MPDLEKTIRGLQCHSEPKQSLDECFCETCPYDELTCGLDVPNDALSLLKAKIPRVMTLEEVAELEEHQFVWIEPKNSDEPLYFLEIVQLCGIVSINMEISLNTPSSIYFVYTKNYNKNYRFWSSRPTDEQRSEVKWDE